MPFKDLKKKKAYVDKYNREHPISKKRRRAYYLAAKLKEFRRIINEEQGNIFSQETI
jgi:hypothetical protein